MRKLGGIAFVVLGIVLLLWGDDASDSIASRISRTFRGGPSDRAMWLLMGGSASVVTGLALMLPSRRSGKTK